MRIHRIRSLLPAYPGARILLAFEYDLEGLAAGAEIPVSETIALCQNGVALKTWPRSAKKRAGKYEPHEFAELPRNLQPATYELVARVAAGNAIAQASAPLEILGE
ncbi:MAG: hypothetical protein BWZ10_03394 [candidate division BRC1 bacterium ADurb.BinA364]|nr:MAG: hypothetical protein BWZ10_03394 [candidate division BRC1 bacterium ADurb.BinA364]